LLLAGVVSFHPAGAFSRMARSSWRASITQSLPGSPLRRVILQGISTALRRETGSLISTPPLRSGVKAPFSLSIRGSPSRKPAQVTPALSTYDDGWLTRVRTFGSIRKNS
jgi:hypothetical protein